MRRLRVRLSKTPLELFDSRPECVFSDVHAAGKNDLYGFRACVRETLRGFFDTLKRNRQQPVPLLHAFGWYLL